MKVKTTVKRTLQRTERCREREEELAEVCPTTVCLNLIVTAKRKMS